jgi:phenylacetate-CoA ligase
VFAVGIGEAGNFVLSDPTRATGLYVEVALDIADPVSKRRAIELIRDLRPPVVSSRPNLFALLLEGGAQVDLGNYRPTAVMSGGEILLPQMRRRLEQFFGCRVINRYGMSEVGLIASECTHGFLHIDTSAHYVEIVSDSRKPVGTEEVGHIVISSIGNRAMPLLRYKTGDVGAISVEPCKCGHHFPRLVHFRGREIPNFKLPGEREFSPLLLTVEIFERFKNVNNLQLVQESDSSLTLLIEFTDNSEAHTEELRSIAQFARAMLPIDDMELLYRAVRFPRGGKFQRYQSFVR